MLHSLSAELLQLAQLGAGSVWAVQHELGDAQRRVSWEDEQRPTRPSSA